MNLLYGMMQSENPLIKQGPTITGGFLADQGRYIQAMSDFTKAIDIGPHYAGAYYNRANI